MCVFFFNQCSYNRIYVKHIWDWKLKRSADWKTFWRLVLCFFAGPSTFVGRSSMENMRSGWSRYGYLQLLLVQIHLFSERCNYKEINYWLLNTKSHFLKLDVKALKGRWNPQDMIKHIQFYNGAWRNQDAMIQKPFKLQIASYISVQEQPWQAAELLIFYN